MSRLSENNQVDNKFEPLIDTWGEIDNVLESIESIPQGEPTGVVLSTIEGPIMDYTNPTRNNRLYSKSLCQSVMNSDYVRELIDNKCFLGEADHPEDNRLTVHFPYVSHAIRDIREDPVRGCYVATIDILDTPNGRILETLRRYGTKLGISSRGAGNVIHKNGTPMIEESSYIFVTFDIVHLPGVEKARLTDVGSTNESIGYEQDELENLTSILHSYNKESYDSDYESYLDDVINKAMSQGDLQTLWYCKSVLNALDIRPDLKTRIDSFLDRDESPLVKSLLGELSTSQDELNKATKALSDLSTKLNSKSDDDIDKLNTIIDDLHYDIDQYRSKLEVAYKEATRSTEEIDELSNRVKNLTKSKIELISKYKDSYEELERDYEELEDSILTQKRQYDDLLNSYKTIRCNQLGIDINLLNQYNDLNSVKSIEEKLSRIKYIPNAPHQKVSVNESIKVSSAVETNSPLVQLVKSLKS